MCDALGCKKQKAKLCERSPEQCLSFLTLVPLTRTTNSHSRTDTTERLLAHGVRLKHPLHLRAQDRPNYQGNRGRYTLTASPVSHAGAAPCGDVTLEPPVPPGKREPGSTSLYSIVGHFVRAHTPQGLQGSAGSTTTLTMMGKREGLATTSKWISADLTCPRTLPADTPRNPS